MLSAMTPSIVLDKERRLYLIAGTPGGPKIITMVYHVISNLIDHRMSLPEAVRAPRVGWRPSARRTSARGRRC